MKEEMMRVVRYGEFGAVGDGVTDDFAAIAKCHEYANENGCKVMADDGAKYYIGDTNGAAAVVKTDVDWRDATFIVDDSIIPPSSPTRTAQLFKIERDYAKKVFDADSEVVKGMNAACPIKAFETCNVGYAPGHPALLVIYNNNHSAFIRWGCHATAKPNPQRELVTVDKDGNIDKETMLLLDFNEVTKVEEFRIDDKPITLEGGKFITIANCAPPVYTAYSRGLGVNRSNVTIKNVVHTIERETETGAPYGGFISYHCLDNLRCENLTLSSHKSYRDYKPDGTVHSIMGSYDIGGSFATNVSFHNCPQCNYWKDEAAGIAYNESERWGIMGTNYCKNLAYYGCTLSRLDAHAGVYNVTIKDTTISYIKLTGGGTARIENCKIVHPEDRNFPVAELRCDYGSTWCGDIIIKDVEYINLGKEYTIGLISASWNNWNFGYVTHLPRVTVDNLKISDPSEKVFCFTRLTREAGTKIDMPVLDNGETNLNPMDIETTVTFKNDPGYNYFGCLDEYVSSKITLKHEK